MSRVGGLSGKVTLLMFRETHSETEASIKSGPLLGPALLLLMTPLRLIKIGPSKSRREPA